MAWNGDDVAEVLVQQIRLDSNRRPRVRPVLSRPGGYSYIWRDATSVRWDELSNELYVTGDALTAIEEFRLIISAVAREHGDRLILSPSTAYVDVPSEMIAAFMQQNDRPL